MSAVFRQLGFPSDYWVRHVSVLHRPEYFSVDPKIEKMLTAIAEARVAHSLFTTVKTSQMREILKLIRLNKDLFDFVISGDDVLERKPALDGFYKVIELAHVTPEHILYVGDEEAKDIIPAKRVGIQTALVWSDKQSDVADYTFPDVYRVASLLPRQ